MERVQPVEQVQRAQAGQFGALLRQELERREPAISFSKHAQSRALERAFSAPLPPEVWEGLEAQMEEVGPDV